MYKLVLNIITRFYVIFNRNVAPFLWKIYALLCYRSKNTRKFSHFFI